MLIEKLLTTGTVDQEPGYLLYTWGSGTEGRLGLNEDFRKSWISVGVGQQFTAAIASDGALFTWGINSFGQLGSNVQTNTRRSSPVQVGSDSWTFVSAGISSAHAIRNDGALFAWGRNEYGRLGDGGAVDRSSPVQIGSSSWIAVSNNERNSAAIRSDGALFTWGLNTVPGGGTLLGNNNTGHRSSPIQIGSDSWTAVSVGRSHVAAIRSDGALFTWGEYTVLGEAEYLETFDITGHGIAINNNGKLLTWADNTWGQLGVSDRTFRSAAVQVGNSSWTAVAGGSAASFGITSDGALYAWGSNNLGQLGLSDIVNRSSPVQVGSSSWIMVECGDVGSVSAGITSNNMLYVWGDNGIGQIGDGTNVRKSSPIQVGNSSWTAVSVGRSHVAAIRSDGALFTWGWNLYGQLGTNNTANTSSPIQIGSDSWTAVSCGLSHTAAIRSDGALFTWGSNGTGRLGDGTTISKSSPVQIGANSWVAISAGNANTIAERNDGLLFVWGSNEFGQLGINSGFFVNRSSPIQFGSSIGPMSLIGRLKTLITFGQTADKVVWGCGYSSQGQLLQNIQGSTAHRSAPVQIISSTRKSSPAQIGIGHSWNAVSAGVGHSLAIRSDGLLFAWGTNNYGQIGVQDKSINYQSPVQIGNSSWTAISAGMNISLAIDANNRLFAWGNGSEGAIGDGTTISKSSPVQIGSSSWNFVSAIKTLNSFSIGKHNAAISSNNVLSLMGGNNYGQLGFGNVIDRSSPVQLGSITPPPKSSPTQVGLGTSPIVSWHSISAGYDHMIALRSDKILFAWGNNSFGQLGDGTTIAKSSPVQIGSLKWSSVSAGGQFSAAIDENNKLFTWGVNNTCQLGDGTTIFKSSPVQIGSNNWKIVSADGGGGNITFSGGHCLAIREDDLLFAWGQGGQGQLGTGGFATRSSPVQIGSSSWTAVSAGFDHSLGITSDGLLFAWGGNSSGQLGNSSTASRSSPVQIGSSSWTQISAAERFNLAIRSDGLLFTWGLNGQGQLGDGTILPKSSPVQIGSSSWTVVSGGGSGGVNHAAAIRSDGALFTWGTNFNGQLGDGTTIAKSSPVQIGANTWYDVSIGNGFSAGLEN